MKRTASWLVVTLALGAGAMAASSGCELIASVDPSLVEEDAGPGAGGGSTTSTSQGGGGMTSTSNTGGGGMTSTSNTGGSGGTGGTGVGGTGGTGGTGGAGGGCQSPADCPAPANECELATCNGGACGIDFVADGTPIANQTAHDCKKVVCDGAGGTKSADDDADVVDDGTACTLDTCSGGTPAQMNEMPGIACSDNNGAMCDGNGKCVECLTNAECAPSICVNGACTGKALGDACGGANECDSGFCADGVCCDTACTGTCMACSVAAKGAADGTCGPVDSGFDPANDCADASCSAGMETPAAHCDGAGACTTPAASSCGEYVCGANACKTSCATDADCKAGDHCKADGTCQTPIASGAACDDATDCKVSGCLACAGGVACPMPGGGGGGGGAGGGGAGPTVCP